jgi:flagellar motor protein MotB
MKFPGKPSTADGRIPLRILPSYRYWIRVFPVLLTVLSCLTAGAALAGHPSAAFQQKALKQKQLLEMMLLDHLDRKQDLENEMPDLKARYEWTGHMIERCADREQQIPESARTHHEQLALHIEAKTREISRLEAMIDEQAAQLETLDEAVREAFAAQSLDWWTFHPAVSAFLPPADDASSGNAVSAGGENGGGPLFQRLRRKIAENAIADWVALTHGSEGPVLKVDLPILFGLGKITISDKYQAFLKKLAHVVKDHIIHVKIEGFADHTPLKSRKKYASNWDLAARRALSVARILIEEGVKRSACSIISHGENGELSKPANRRVEMTVFFKE